MLKYNPVLCKWLEYKTDLPWLNERYFLPSVYMLLQMWAFLSCKCFFLEFFLLTPWRGKKQIRIWVFCCLFGKEDFHEYQNKNCSMKNNLNGFLALYKQTMKTWNKWKILNYGTETVGEIRYELNIQDTSSMWDYKDHLFKSPHLLIVVSCSVCLCVYVTC